MAEKEKKQREEQPHSRLERLEETLGEAMGLNALEYANTGDLMYI